MRTTVDLPEDLVRDAMAATKARTKTEMLKMAMENIIRQEKRNRLIRFHGRLDLGIDLDDLRQR